MSARILQLQGGGFGNEDVDRSRNHRWSSVPACENLNLVMLSCLRIGQTHQQNFVLENGRSAT